MRPRSIDNLGSKDPMIDLLIEKRKALDRNWKINWDPKEYTRLQQKIQDLQRKIKALKEQPERRPRTLI